LDVGELGTGSLANTGPLGHQWHPCRPFAGRACAPVTASWPWTGGARKSWLRNTVPGFPDLRDWLLGWESLLLKDCSGSIRLAVYVHLCTPNVSRIPSRASSEETRSSTLCYIAAVLPPVLSLRCSVTAAVMSMPINAVPLFSMRLWPRLTFISARAFSSQPTTPAKFRPRRVGRSPRGRKR
jgi:hypothetical protein